MRRLKLIGIGAGNPDYITMQAINALREVDVVFVTDKGDDTTDLLRARKEVCERYMQAKPCRIIEIQDPERDRRPAAYRSAVAAWHEKRADLYEQVDQVSARRTVDFEWEVIPGITSIQALAARHKIALNEIGESIRITTGRRLVDEQPAVGTNVLVLLDGNCAFKTLTNDDIDIYWGAYLGTPEEILLSGRLSDLSEQIEHVRAHARNQKGWIMDTYLLRKRGASSC